MSPKDQVKQALRAGRKHQADKEVENVVPTISQQNFQAQAEQEIEQTVGNDLESLLAQIDTLDPEARAVAQRHLDATELGIKLKERNKEEVVGYDNLENNLRRVTESIEWLERGAREYKGLCPAYHSHRERLRELVKAGVIDQNDEKIYRETLRKVHRIFRRNEFESEQSYLKRHEKRSTLESRIIGAGVTGTVWMKILSVNSIVGDFEVDGIADIVGLIIAGGASAVIGSQFLFWIGAKGYLTIKDVTNKIIFGKEKYRYKKAAMKHLEEEGKDYERTKEILARTAKRIYKKLGQPEKVYLKESTRLDLNDLRKETMNYISQLQEFLKET